MTAGLAAVGRGGSYGRRRACALRSRRGTVGTVFFFHTDRTRQTREARGSDGDGQEETARPDRETADKAPEPTSAFSMLTVCGSGSDRTLSG